MHSVDSDQMVQEITTHLKAKDTELLLANRRFEKAAKKAEALAAEVAERDRKIAELEALLKEAP
mgnify:FL=1